jgi:hypothetical protein
MGEMHREINVLWRITMACDTIAAEIARYGFNRACKTRLMWERQDIEQSAAFAKPHSSASACISQKYLFESKQYVIFSCKKLLLFMLHVTDYLSTQFYKTQIS